jgi:hypothetical protein
MAFCILSAFQTLQEFDEAFDASRSNQSVDVQKSKTSNQRIVQHSFVDQMESIK